MHKNAPINLPLEVPDPLIKEFYSLNPSLVSDFLTVCRFPERSAGPHQKQTLRCLRRFLKSARLRDPNSVHFTTFEQRIIGALNHLNWDLSELFSSSKIILSDLQVPLIHEPLKDELPEIIRALPISFKTWTWSVNAKPGEVDFLARNLDCTAKISFHTIANLEGQIRANIYYTTWLNSHTRDHTQLFFSLPYTFLWTHVRMLHEVVPYIARRYHYHLTHHPKVRARKIHRLLGGTTPR